jgi:hypothetical protein
VTTRKKGTEATGSVIFRFRTEPKIFAELARFNSSTHVPCDPLGSLSRDSKMGGA